MPGLVVPPRGTVWDTVGHRSIRFPEDLEGRLRALAEAEGRSFSNLVVRTLEQALGGQGSGDTRSVSSPRESGVVEEVRATGHPASARAPYVRPFNPRPKGKA